MTFAKLDQCLDQPHVQFLDMPTSVIDPFDQILRHLVMPRNLAGTDRFVRWVAEELSPDTYVNIMDQYRPSHDAFEYPEIARHLEREEWKQAVRWAKDSGLTNLDL